MTTKQLLSSNSYIQFPKFLGAHIGPNEALLLSVFCDVDSWCNFNIEDYDGWFYILQNDILWETGLSEKQQRAALSHLYELNIIYIEKRDVPAKNYYFINTNELENVINDAYINYKAHKIQMLQNVTSRPDKMSYQDTTKNSVSSIKTKNKNIKINNKSTGAGALSKKHPRNFSKEKLTDDLESGKDIDEQKKEKKKTDKFDRCLAEIDKRDFTENEKALLRQHLNWSFHDTDVNRNNEPKKYAKRLDTLLSLKGNRENIIQQSIDRQWHCFYDEVKQRSTTNKHECFTESIHSTPIEEARAAMKEKKQRGVKTY